jgi:hypothetical protein
MARVCSTHNNIKSCYIEDHLDSLKHFSVYTYMWAHMALCLHNAHQLTP